MNAPISIIREIRYRIWDGVAEDQALDLVRLAATREDVADALRRFLASGRDPVVVCPFGVKVHPADGAIVLHLIEKLHEELGSLLAAGGAAGGHAAHDASPDGGGAAEVRGPP